MAAAVAGRSCYKDTLPFTAMVTMECMNVGLNTLFKAATMRGMSYHVFVVYSYSVAAFVLLPTPFISHRSRVLPPLNFSIMSKICLLGVIGSSSQIMGYTGINFSSPTLASAISNLVPAFTFILAIIFSLVGATIISIGFYTVLWGKAKEEEASEDFEADNLESQSNPTHKTPLLQNCKTQK